ncbi:MAG: adenylate kinase [Armatimonadetes bacterium]|nr:adenylate kinase [Armatimonadota bacterium]
MTARRILVYGVCGSGKTTLARRLSERSGIPWHSVDDLTWEAEWTPVGPDVQRERIGNIVSGTEWILDTAYGAWLDVPLSRVELIVGLDYPRWFSFARLLRRAVVRAIDHSPVCNGNVESWRNMASKDSILVWHFKSFRRKRARIRQWASDGTGPSVLVFRSHRECERWLGSLERRFPT